jgi:uncharacterized protein YndB with AHSA1/START domain
VSTTATETIHKEIFIEAAPDTAFRVFTEDIARWWPLHKYGMFLEDAATVAFEDREGWRLVEKAKDGRETMWGEVLDYELSSRLRMTWHPGWDADEEPSEIEVTFAADGDGTLVVLEHRGWEKVSDERKKARTGYDRGWNEVLETYRTAAV